MLSHSKKMASGLFAVMLVFVLSATACSAASYSVRIDLEEIDPYGYVLKRYYPAVSNVSSLYGYNNYLNGCSRWSGAGEYYSGLSADDHGSFRNVPGGTRSFTFRDRFCQPWSGSYTIGSGNTIHILTKEYGNITLCNADGTPWTSSFDYKIHVGPSGLDYASVSAVDTTINCVEYSVAGYRVFLLPLIFNPGNQRYSIYFVDSKAKKIVREYTYEASGLYTNEPWDIGFDPTVLKTRSAESKGGLKKITKDNPVSKARKASQK